MSGLIMASGCSTPQTATKQQTQLQIRQFQTREYDTADTKLIMKAMLNVLQDEEFVVKNAVVDVGLLSAMKEMDISELQKNDGFWGLLKVILKPHDGEPTPFAKFKVIECTVNISEFGVKQSRVRANFQAKVLDNKGVAMEVFTIDDAKFYQEFFAKVDKSLFLQKQRL